MYLENISLLNFKNYPELKVKFSPEINCFVGPNGSGKTNILDAIHYLCLTKSALNFTDAQLVLHKEPYSMVKGAFKTEKDNVSITGAFQNGKKTFKEGVNQYDKLSEHIGKFPIVIISPNDSEIVQEGSEIRRKFFDNILCQYDKEYLLNSIKYAKVLKSRNALLKQFSERRFIDKDLLEPYDIEILNLNQFLYTKRKEMIKEFKPIFDFSYITLTDNAENIELQYESQLADKDFRRKFKQSLERDLFLERTTMGVHKDDFKFVIDEQPLKKYGSQGQQKSYIISLKLGMYKLLEKKKRSKPILLLDDIFDKLDPIRVQKLINMLARGQAGQVFITDTDAERTLRLFKYLKQDIRFFEVVNAEVRNLEKAN